MGKIVINKTTKLAFFAVSDDESILLTQKGIKTPSYNDPFTTSKNFELIRNVEIPEDFVPNKYVYTNGSLVEDPEHYERVRARNQARLEKILARDKEKKEEKGDR